MVSRLQLLWGGKPLLVINLVPRLESGNAFSKAPQHRAWLTGRCAVNLSEHPSVSGGGTSTKGLPARGTPVLGDPDLATVALKIPHGVICLISALAFHEITTHIPHEIYLAVSRGTTHPRLDYPPLRIFWFSERPLKEGTETHVRDGVSVRVYSPEKTLADCFKYRNKIGIDVAIEALKLYRQRKPVRVDNLLRFARVCRVFKVMKPYLETLL